MRRATIAPPTGMSPPMEWDEPSNNSADATSPGRVVDAHTNLATAGGGLPREGCACPVCGLDLTTWTLPDREAHADACLVATFGDADAPTAPRDDFVATRPPGASVSSRADWAPREAGRGSPASHALPATSATLGAWDAWLASVGLEHHAPAFAREELTLTDLPLITEADLRDVVGMTDPEEVRRFARAARGDASRVDATPISAPISAPVDATPISAPISAPVDSAPISAPSRANGPVARGVHRKRARGARRDGDLAAEEAELRGEPTSAEKATRVRVDAAAHDREWLELAMAMSASMEEVPAPVVVARGDYGGVRLVDDSRATTTGAGASSIDAREISRRGARVEARPSTHGAHRTTVPFASDGEDARPERSPSPSTGAVPHAPIDDAGGARENPFDENRRRRAGEVTARGAARERASSALAAARARAARRSVPSRLWAVAGHGGRDRPLPAWVVGGGGGEGPDG